VYALQEAQGTQRFFCVISGRTLLITFDGMYFTPHVSVIILQPFPLTSLTNLHLFSFRLPDNPF
jgi:hypothetical protein